MPSPCSAAGSLRKLTQFYFCLALNSQAVLLHCKIAENLLGPVIYSLSYCRRYLEALFARRLFVTHGAPCAWAIDKEWLYAE